jgi:transcriptional regulator with XRE-family HTH domain
MGRRMKDVLNELNSEKATSGELLRAFRQRDGFTLRDLEEITGIAQSNLSALENDKLEITQHYAEIFAAALGFHPTVILYPNGHFEKSKKLLEIERKANKLKKHA